MDRKEELIKQANQMFKERELLYSVPCSLPSKDITWGENGESNAERASISRSRIDLGFNFSSLFWYNEKLDMLTVWGRGLGILYWRGVWATRDKPTGNPKFIEEIYQIF